MSWLGLIHSQVAMEIAARDALTAAFHGSAAMLIISAVNAAIANAAAAVNEAAAPNASDPKVVDLTSRAAALNTEAQAVSADQTGKAASEREKITAAVTQVFTVIAELATFVKGDYNARSKNTAVQQLLADILRRLHIASTKALESATSSSTEVGALEVKLIDLRDSKLAALKKDTADYLTKQKNEIATDKSSIAVLSQQCKTNEATLSSLRSQLQDAQNKYNDARKSADDMQVGNVFLWVFCWPAGLATQLAVTDKLKNACNDIENMVHTVEQSVQSSSNDLSTAEKKLNQAQADETRASMIAVQVEDILNRVVGIMAFTENVKKHFSILKESMWTNEETVGKLDNATAVAGFEPFKKESLIDDIFDMLHLGLCDPRLIDLKNTIIKSLQDGDVNKVMMSGEVQAKLQLLDTDEKAVVDAWKSIDIAPAKA